VNTDSRPATGHAVPQQRHLGITALSLHKLDAVAACVGVLLGLEVVQGHANLAQQGVAQVLELACRTQSAVSSKGQV
jgi:hypothetical protein